MVCVAECWELWRPRLPGYMNVGMWTTSWHYQDVQRCLDVETGSRLKKICIILHGRDQLFFLTQSYYVLDFVGHTISEITTCLCIIKVDYIYRIWNNERKIVLLYNSALLFVFLSYTKVCKVKFACACYSVLEATDVLLFDWGFFPFASVFVKHLLGTMYSSNSFTLLFRVLSGQCGELWQPINAVHRRNIESWGQTEFTNKNLRSWTHTTLISELFPIGGIRKYLCVWRI